MEGGQLLENGKYPTGTASLTAGMMTEGTTSLTSEQFQNELDKLGSSMGFSASDNPRSGSRAERGEPSREWSSYP